MYSGKYYYGDNARMFSNDLNSIDNYKIEPISFNVSKMTYDNTMFQRVIWVGKYMKIVLNSIPVGSSLGVKIHNDMDQFIQVVVGNGIIRLGDNSSNLNMESMLTNNASVVIPSGKWHNIINTGNMPLKIYSIYAYSSNNNVNYNNKEVF